MGKRLFEDTDEETDRRMIEEARTMTFSQKMQRVSELTEAERQRIMSEIREQHPNDSEEKVRMRFAREWLGRDLAIQAYGYDPEIDG